MMRFLHCANNFFNLHSHTKVCSQLMVFYVGCSSLMISGLYICLHRESLWFRMCRVSVIFLHDVLPYILKITCMGRELCNHAQYLLGNTHMCTWQGKWLFCHFQVVQMTHVIIRQNDLLPVCPGLFPECSCQPC